MSRSEDVYTSDIHSAVHSQFDVRQFRNPRGWERVMLEQVSICLDLGTELLPTRKDRPGNRWRHLAS
jgi:hypothetical protein